MDNDLHMCEQDHRISVLQQDLAHNQEYQILLRHEIGQLKTELEQVYHLAAAWKDTSDQWRRLALRTATVLRAEEEELSVGQTDVF